MFIDRGMRRGTPESDQENVITVYGGADQGKQRVGFSVPNAAYLLLIDQTGKVVWRYSGSLNEEHFKALSSAVTDRLTTL